MSRRMVPYLIPGLSFREFLLMEKGIAIDSISLDGLLESPNSFCTAVKGKCRPLEFFKDYLKKGYYPFYFESRKTYPIQVENVIDYIINVELTQLRGLEVGNTRKVKALLKVISNSVPYEVGGADKDFSQVGDEPDAYVAADDIDSAIGKKIPLWAFGMLY